MVKFQNNRICFTTLSAGMGEKIIPEILPQSISIFCRMLPGVSLLVILVFLIPILSHLWSTIHTIRLTPSRKLISQGKLLYVFFDAAFTANTSGHFCSCKVYLLWYRNRKWQKTAKYGTLDASYHSIYGTLAAKLLITTRFEVCYSVHWATGAILQGRKYVQSVPSFQYLRDVFSIAPILPESLQIACECANTRADPQISNLVLCSLGYHRMQDTKLLLPVWVRSFAELFIQMGNTKALTYSSCVVEYRPICLETKQVSSGKPNPSESPSLQLRLSGLGLFR